jgi:hypothetical protein
VDYFVVHSPPTETYFFVFSPPKQPFFIRLYCSPTSPTVVTCSSKTTRTQRKILHSQPWRIQPHTTDRHHRNRSISTLADLIEFWLGHQLSRCPRSGNFNHNIGETHHLCLYPSNDLRYTAITISISSTTSRYTASTSTISSTTCDTLQAPHRTQHRLAIHCKHLIDLNTDLRYIHCKHLNDLINDLRYTASTSSNSTQTCDTLRAPQRSYQRLAIHCKHLNDLINDLRYTASISTSSNSTQTCETLQAPHRSQHRLAIHCKHLIDLNNDLRYTAST